jgi:SSS family solute:Na+ symporter
VVTNDFIKRYVRFPFTQKQLVRLGQAASALALLIGFVFSLSFSHIVTAWETMIFIWVTVILVPATLRWHYWRFSAQAFVWSMAISVAAILARLLLFPGLPASKALGVDVGLCLVITLTVSALTRPTDIEVLVRFYARVRPWGIWGPVRREAVRRGLIPAKDPMPAIDAMNGLLTAVFQFSLALIPFYMFLRRWNEFLTWLGAALILVVILYFTWYKNLPAKDEV